MIVLQTTTFNIKYCSFLLYPAVFLGTNPDEDKKKKIQQQ